MTSCWRNATDVVGRVTRACRRKAGELFRRMTTGDLVGEFQVALDVDLETDPLLAAIVATLKPARL